MKLEKLSQYICNTFLCTPILDKKGRIKNLKMLKKDHPEIVQVLAFGVQKGSINYDKCQSLLARLESLDLEYIFAQYTCNDIITQEHKKLATIPQYAVGSNIA